MDEHAEEIILPNILKRWREVGGEDGMRGAGGDGGIMRFNIIILLHGGVVRGFDERKGGGGRKYN